jgi:pyruvate/2-oxoglutarate dehydrogenase complex dihydrolipoamide dehydrogenase (E3) component
MSRPSGLNLKRSFMSAQYDVIVIGAGRRLCSHSRDRTRKLLSMAGNLRQLCLGGTCLNAGAFLQALLERPVVTVRNRVCTAAHQINGNRAPAGAR